MAYGIWAPSKWLPRGRRVLQRRLRHASGICTTLCRFPRMHSLAERNGEKILRECPRRDTSESNRVAKTSGFGRNRHRSQRKNARPQRARKYPGRRLETAEEAKARRIAAILRSDPIDRRRIRPARISRWWSGRGSRPDQS